MQANPSLEPDDQVVRTQIAVFKSSETAALDKLGNSKQVEKKQALEDGAAAKVLEEMKLVVRELPILLEHRLADSTMRGSRRLRRFHPAMFLDMLSVETPRREGIGLLMLCGILRDDFPWLYEMAAEVYKTFQEGNSAERQEAAEKFLEVSQMTFHGPLSDIFAANREVFSTYKEIQMILEEYVHRLLANPPKKRPRVRPI